MSKFWILSLSLFTLFPILFSGCASTSAVDPGQRAATYRFGVFTSFLPKSVNHNFQAAKIAMDESGLFRTGQRVRENRIEIYARTRQDIQVEVVLRPTTDGGTQATIKWGNFGDEEESTRLFERILQTSESI